MQNQLKTIVMALAVGTLLGGSVVFITLDRTTDIESDTASAESSEPKPLYWVAPMDPSYRRDQPGKSPMGMDLVPVYPDGASERGDDAVQISSAVAHNLGTRTAVAERRALTESIPVFAQLQWDESRLAHVHPRVEGWVEQLNVAAAGDRVEQGEPLFTLYSPTWVNAQEELIVALERGRPELINAASDRLYALQVPESVIQNVKATRRVHRSVLVPASTSGVVNTLNIREGMFVQPGMEVMAIAPTDRLWLVVEGLQPVAPKVLANATLELADPDQPGGFSRVPIDYVYPMVDLPRRTWKARASVDNAAGFLMPGMFVAARLELPATQPMLVIPREALIQTGDGDRVVLALGDNRYRSVEVTSGRRVGDWVEIQSGLQTGQRFVTSAQFMIDAESNRRAALTEMAVDDSGEPLGEESAQDEHRTHNSVMEHGATDHSTMDHSKMDHSQMDHSKMDHSQMDHSQMGHGVEQDVEGLEND